MILQGLAHFPGVWQIQSCEVSFSHGIIPSVFRLNIAPQINFPAVGGHLTLSFGGKRIRFFGCRVNSASVMRNQGGLVVSLEIYDRRWRWQDDMGSISGHYNTRRANNEILQRVKGSPHAIEDTERTPQQLARLCLDAMGEQGCDVSALPNEFRPQVDWEVESPARAMENLCEELGCRVVLGPLTNRVKLCKVGVGAQLPNGPIAERSGTIDPPERPDELIVAAGPTRHQVDFFLEAVGLETDGSIKPIAELSYRPDKTATDGGWSKIDLATFEGVSDDDHRQLAKATVFKWHRVKASTSSPLIVPTLNRDSQKITDREMFQLETEQVETVTEDGLKKNKPAEVFGIWWREDKDYEGNTAMSLAPITETDKTVVSQSFSVDVANDVVKFSQAVYKGSGSGGSWVKAAADLVLRTSCIIKSKKTGAWRRHKRERKNKGRRFGTKPKYIPREELVCCYWSTYSRYNTTGAGNYTPVVSRKHNNIAEIKKQADHILDAAERQYQMKMPETVRYAGLIPIALDGAIQSVTYTIGSQGTFTVANRNHDPPTVVNVSYQEKRRIERAKEAADVAKKIFAFVGRFVNVKLS